MSYRHPLRSHWKRAVLALCSVTLVVLVGTVGMHRLEHMAYLDAFYFMSMIATAQGPVAVPATPAGKLFAACMAFISVGTAVAALGFLFGPFLGELWHIGVRRFDERIQSWENKSRKEK